MQLAKNKFFYLTILSAIIAIGFFLRGYEFSDWLHFELDQARDAKIVDLAVKDGIGNLPLLGPKAAGSFLRLGPVFYYMEYVSALIFGNTPAGIAALSLLLSLAAIFVFYLFIRRYFSKRISLGLAFLFSVSLFLVMYARFAWNPNTLPFFVLLSFYALLRAVDREEKRRGLWLAVFSGALAFATQLHFVAFLAMPAISASFLIMKRPRIRIKYWLAALGIIVFLYSPVIINEMKTGGDNAKEFTKVFEKKSTKDGEKSLVEKAVRNFSEDSLAYFLILSGYGEAELPKLAKSANGFDLQCPANCRKNLPLGAMAALIFAAGFILAVLNFKKAIFKKENVEKKDFAILIFLWMTVVFILYIPIAYNLAPRFFLLVSPLPFIFLGFILEFLGRRMKNGEIFSIIFSVIILILAISNLWFIKHRFEEMRNAPEKSFDTKTDRILKERYRVTLEQQLLIVEYMEKIYRQNKFPVYLNSEAFYRRALLYHLEKKDIPRDDFRNASNAKKIYREGNYFLVYPTAGNMEARKAGYLSDYDIIDTKSFGTLTAFRLTPKKEKINAGRQEFGPEKKARSASGVPVRCRWNEIFKECNPDEVIGDESGEL